MELDQPLNVAWANLRAAQKGMQFSAVNSSAFPAAGAKIMTRADALKAQDTKQILKVDGPFAVVTMLHRMTGTKKAAVEGGGVMWSGDLQFEYQNQKLSLPVSFKFGADVDWPSELQVSR
jgi:hypothetical protein